jgi:hypothetical protein
MGDLVEWYCPKHGPITRYPENGYGEPPNVCPGPWDDEADAPVGEWCDETPRRRIVPDQHPQDLWSQNGHSASRRTPRAASRGVTAHLVGKPG